MFSARPAPAGTPEPSADQITERARRAFKRGHPQEAIEGFGRAYQLSGDPERLFDMAEAHRALGHFTDALRLYQTYLRRAPQGENRGKAEQQIEDLERRTAESPPEPNPTPVPASTHPVPNVESRVSSPEAPPVRSKPEAVSPTAGAPGTDLRATNVAPDLADAAPEVRGHAPVPHWVPWTLAGTALASGAGAIVAGVAATKRYNDLGASCGQTDAGCTSDQIQVVKSRALIANVLWGLAGATAIAAGITIFVDTRASAVSMAWRY